MSKTTEELLREASVQEIKERGVDKREYMLSWIENAMRGEQYVYFTGHWLAGQTFKIWQIKVAAWKLAVEGRAILLQRKLGTDYYQYIIQKPRRSLPPRLIPDDYKQR